jgi:flagellar biosynthesis protein FlhB
LEELLTYLTIYASSTIKFIFGPSIGVASQANWILTSICTAMGMMTSVVVFSFFGNQIRGLVKLIFNQEKKKVFTKRNRQFVRIWKSYGVVGVAFFTPLLLTPIGGTILANAFGCSRSDIFKYMMISSLFWSFVITYILYYARAIIETS